MRASDGAMRERDPMVDPRPGDVFSGPLGTVVTVTAIDRGTVHFTLSGGGEDRRPIGAFRRWAKTATIITRGD